MTGFSNGATSGWTGSADPEGDLEARIAAATTLSELDRLYPDAQLREHTFRLWEASREALEGSGAAGHREEPDARSRPDVVPPRTDRVDVPPPAAPLDVARRIIQDAYTTDGMTGLVFWRGLWWQWNGRAWPECENEAVVAAAYRFLENAEFIGDKGDVRPWRPTRSKIGNVVEAMQALTWLSRETEAPSWLDVDGASDTDVRHLLGLDPRDLVVVSNGILHLPATQLYAHSPRLFTMTSLPFAYRSSAPQPQRWLAFLAELFEDDPDCVQLLRQIFGYVLSGDTSLQKILAIVGPPRAGKGVIANVLTGLLGRRNVTNPTLSGLATNFGMQDLIGKPLAVISDARLGRQADVHTLVERLLTISGEDGITIDRKYLTPWTGRLPTRFLMLTNELPRFTDASGALAKRFVILPLTKSFFGRENHSLFEELVPELPGILNWALDGTDEIREIGRFSEPESMRRAVQDLEDLASPITAFLRDDCIVRPEATVAVEDAWQAWQDWCARQGRRHGTRQTFGRDLHAAVPGLRMTRPRDGEARARRYVGVGLMAGVEVRGR